LENGSYSGRPFWEDAGSSRPIEGWRGHSGGKKREERRRRVGTFIYHQGSCLTRIRGNIKHDETKTAGETAEKDGFKECCVGRPRLPILSKKWGTRRQRTQGTGQLTEREIEMGDVMGEAKRNGFFNKETSASKRSSDLFPIKGWPNSRVV